MDTEAAESVFKCLEQVLDPRMARGIRHSFQAVLRLTLLGLACGQTIALFARMNWPLPKEPLGFQRDHPPHVTTVARTEYYSRRWSLGVFDGPAFAKSSYGQRLRSK